MSEQNFVLRPEDQALYDEFVGVQHEHAEQEQALLCIRGTIRLAARLLAEPNLQKQTIMEAQFASQMAAMGVTPEAYIAARETHMLIRELLASSEKFQDALRVARGQQRRIQWKRPPEDRTRSGRA